MKRALTANDRRFGAGPRRRPSRTGISLKPLGVWFAALGLSAIPWQALHETRLAPSDAAQARLAQALLQRAHAALPEDSQPLWARTGLPTVLPAGATAAPVVVPSSDTPVRVAAAAAIVVRDVAAAAAPDVVASLFDPVYLGSEPQKLGEKLPLAAAMRSPDVRDETVAVLSAPAVVTASLDLRESVPTLEDRPTMLDVPEPLPRPFSLQSTPALERPRLAVAPPTRRTREALAAATPSDDRGFFDKIFGVQKPSGPALAYAVPQDDVIDAARGRRLSPVRTTDGTAVYDIAAKVVYLPNGEKLEAHSGFGDRRDDPGSVHISMKGATPPHLYDLTLREQLFHGVRALRLNPVGGSEAIHNRVGLLAHTFMLGPNGDSNGCVSFRDYDRFLQAYLRGDVKRLLVVANAN